MMASPKKEKQIIGLVIAIITLVFCIIVCLIAYAKEQARKEEYRNYAKQLNSSGRKVIYYNETTGTIRYRGKDKRIHSESLYRGYRSHWRG